jgi:hypothetical protein
VRSRSADSSATVSPVGASPSTASSSVRPAATIGSPRTVATRSASSWTGRICRIGAAVGEAAGRATTPATSTSPDTASASAPVVSVSGDNVAETAVPAG